MSNFFRVTLLAFVLLLSCASSSTDQKIPNNDLLTSGTFTFQAERAFPLNINEINNISGNMPGGNANLLTDLYGDGYTIVVTKDKVTIDLPYFGRVFSNASMSTTDIGLDYISKDFDYELSKEKNKNILTIKPNDIKNINDIYIEVGDDNSAYVTVNLNDRQPISYDGIISPNKDPKSRR